MSAATGCGWRLVAQHAAGLSHRAAGLPCQDRAIAELTPLAEGSPPALVAAVADGAGSAEHGEQGAEQAVSAALAVLKSGVASCADAAAALELVRTAFAAAQADLFETSEREGLEPRALSTTLMVALITPRFACFGQIGDGAIVYGDADGLGLAFVVEQEMVNVTDFVTEEGAVDRVMLRTVEAPVTRLAMTSDGLVPLLIHRRDQAPHLPAFRQFFTTLLHSTDEPSLAAELREFLDSAGVNERTDDDKSLVLAAREADA